MHISAIICAAGQGKRMGLGRNKQFLELNGKPLLVHTLQKWLSFIGIKQLVVVVSEGDLEEVQQMIQGYGLQSQSTKIMLVIGGQERQDSVYQGLLALQATAPDAVLIHDGARPFVTAEQIEQLIRVLETDTAAVLAVPVKDTIKRVDDKGHITETLQRNELWAIQTPQAFHYSLIMGAHQHALEQEILATDDAALVEAVGHRVKVVQGHEHNIKLTTPEDILLATYLLEKLNQVHDKDEENTS